MTAPCTSASGFFRRDRLNLDIATLYSLSQACGDLVHTTSVRNVDQPNG